MMIAIYSKLWQKNYIKLTIFLLLGHTTCWWFTRYTMLTAWQPYCPHVGYLLTSDLMMGINWKVASYVGLHGTVTGRMALRIDSMSGSWEPQHPEHPCFLCHCLGRSTWMHRERPLSQGSGETELGLDWLHVHLWSVGMLILSPYPGIPWSPILEEAEWGLQDLEEIYSAGLPFPENGIQHQRLLVLTPPSMTGVVTLHGVDSACGLVSGSRRTCPWFLSHIYVPERLLPQDLHALQQPTC